MYNVMFLRNEVRKKIKRQLSRPGKETQHMASYEETMEGRKEGSV